MEVDRFIISSSQCTAHNILRVLQQLCSSNSAEVTSCRLKSNEMSGVLHLFRT